MSESKLTTGSGYCLKSIDHPRCVFDVSNFKIHFSPNELIHGAERSNTIRQAERSNRSAAPIFNNFRGKSHLRIYLKEVFVFAEHQDNATGVSE